MPMVTPRDRLTRLPLPILPYESAGETSEHHAAHPSWSPLLEGDGGEAVRSARLQTVKGLGGRATKSQLNNPVGYVGDHALYHYWYQGPELPRTRQEQFEYVIWATIPYIPTKAISFQNKRPVVVRMKPEQIANVRRHIKGEDSSKVTEFMRNYVLEQDLSHINGNLIDEFVNSEDEKRRYFLGHWLLAQAAEVATEPIENRYKIARSLGRIPLQRVKLPNIVKSRFRVKRNGRLEEEYMFDEMRQRLRGEELSFVSEQSELEVAA